MLILPFQTEAIAADLFLWFIELQIWQFLGIRTRSKMLKRSSRNGMILWNDSSTFFPILWTYLVLRTALFPASLLWSAFNSIFMIKVLPTLSRD